MACGKPSTFSIVVGEDVVREMARAFRSTGGGLAERFVAALRHDAVPLGGGLPPWRGRCVWHAVGFSRYGAGASQTRL